MKNFIEDIKKKLGNNLVLIGEYSRKERNYVIVVDTSSYETLQSIKPSITSFFKKTKIYPLLLTKKEVLNGVDVFPLDFLNLKNTITLLYGKNIFKDLKVEKKHVRHELEFEVRSKLMNFRRIVLQLKSKRDITLVLQNTVVTLLPLFNGLLFLKGRSRIASVHALLDELKELYKIDFAILKQFNKPKVIASDENIATVHLFLSDLAKLIDTLQYA